LKALQTGGENNLDCGELQQCTSASSLTMYVLKVLLLSPLAECLHLHVKTNQRFEKREVADFNVENAKFINKN